MILRTLIKKHQDIIEKYYPTIALISTILGGARQIGALANIDISYIRFFSVTQIIPDGITIIMIFLILICLGMIVWIFSDKETYESNNEDRREVSAEDIIGIQLATVILLGVPIVIFWKQIIDNSSFLYVRVPLGIIIYITYLIKNKYHKINSMIKKHLHIVFILATLLVLVGTIYILRSAGHLETNDPNVKTIYYNDKYIFFEVTNNSGTFIEIRPFEELFTSNPPTNSGQLTSTP